MTKPRKEKVLHTRVPAVLEEELKRLATSLRVPVSNVVRTILQDAVETIDAVQDRAEDELRGLIERKRVGGLRVEKVGRNVIAKLPDPSFDDHVSRAPASR